MDYPKTDAEIRMFCLEMTKSDIFDHPDIEKAQEFVDYYARNLDLPDFDPIQPTFIQQIRGNASDLFSWVKENQSDIVQGYQFIQSIIKNRGEIPLMVSAEEALPSINE